MCSSSFGAPISDIRYLIRLFVSSLSVPRSETTMTTARASDRHRPQTPTVLDTKENLRPWWKQFTPTQQPKKEPGEKRGAYSFFLLSQTPPRRKLAALPPIPTTQSVVFGKPLKESLKYASVQISTANANGELYVWGYIPVVVAKWCVSFTLTFASSSLTPDTTSAVSI